MVRSRHPGLVGASNVVAVAVLSCSKMQQHPNTGASCMHLLMQQCLPHGMPILAASAMAQLTQCCQCAPAPYLQREHHNILLLLLAAIRWPSSSTEV